MKPRQSTKRNRWTEVGMGQAIETVETWESGRNRASLDCGVPKSTLKDGISVCVVDGCMPRPRPYLSPGEEKELLVLAMVRIY